MKKLLILPIILCLIFTVSANAPLVNDHANLLTEDQVQELTVLLEEIQSELDIDVVILTEESLDGASTVEYADDYFDRNGYGPDGVLLLVDMENRNWWISTCGSCIPYVDAKELGMYFVSYLSDGAYEDAFILFAKLVEAVMENPGVKGDFIVDSNGDIHVQPKAKQWYDGIWQCLLIGGVIGLIVVGVMASGMKTIRAKYTAADYVDRDSLQLTRKSDIYLYQTLIRRAKPKNNGGSHRSSSGRSHGGGGGRF